MGIFFGVARCKTTYGSWSAHFLGPLPGKSAFYGQLGVSGGENPPQGVSG